MYILYPNSFVYILLITDILLLKNTMYIIFSFARLSKSPLAVLTRALPPKTLHALLIASEHFPTSPLSSPRSVFLSMPHHQPSFQLDSTHSNYICELVGCVSPVIIVRVDQCLRCLNVNNICSWGIQSTKLPLPMQKQNVCILWLMQ